MPLGFGRAILTRGISSQITQAAYLEQTGSDSIDYFSTASYPGGPSGSSYVGMIGRDSGYNQGDMQITVYPSNSSFYFNSAMTDGWCIEAWCRVTNGADGPTSANPFFTLGSTITANPKAEWDDSGGVGRWRFFDPSGSATATSVTSTDLESWHHIAIQVPIGGGYFQWLLDGQVISSTSWSDTSSTRTFTMGPYGPEVTAGYRFIWDEIRLSNTQRYIYDSASEYTVPTSVFTSDSNTLGLFHLEQNTNDSTT